MLPGLVVFFRLTELTEESFFLLKNHHNNIIFQSKLFLDWCTKIVQFCRCYAVFVPMWELCRDQRLLAKCCNFFVVHSEYHVRMSKESKAPDFSNELESFADIESLESEEMWSSRVIDEHSRKESRTIIVTQLSLQNHSTKSWFLEVVSSSNSSKINFKLPWNS